MSVIRHWLVYWRTAPGGRPLVVTSESEAKGYALRDGLRVEGPFVPEPPQGAVEERDALQKLVNLYREHGSPDLTRRVNHEAMRTPPLGGQ
jgi:hypothetical protein